jgi:hypothetical protein
MGAPNNSTNTNCQGAASAVRRRSSRPRHPPRPAPPHTPPAQASARHVSGSPHPVSPLHHHDQLLSFTENPLLTKTNAQITTDSSSCCPTRTGRDMPDSAVDVPAEMSGESSENKSGRVGQFDCMCRQPPHGLAAANPDDTGTRTKAARRLITSQAVGIYTAQQCRVGIVDQPE